MRLACFVLIMLTNVANAQFNLVGNASANGNNCYTLTPELGTQMGAIWYNQQINLLQPFDIRAQIYLGNRNGNGADGMAFVIQQQSINSGSTGGGLGYENITPSLTVEFDTYRNATFNDPAFHHMAIMKNGVTNHNNSLVPAVAIMPNNANADDGQFHSVRFTWDPVTKVFNTYFDCVLKLTYTGDILNSIFNGNSTAFWGFTAATGGVVNLHRVCDVNNSQFYTLNHNDTACINSTVQLSSINIGNATYSWQPSTGLSNAFAQNPTFTVTTSQQYICTVTDVCNGQIFKDTFNIVATPAPEKPTIISNSPVCNGSSLQLSIANINNAFTYQWALPNGTGIISTNINIPANQVGNGGMYTCFAKAGNCISNTDTLVAAVLPFTPFTTKKVDTSCAGGNIQFNTIGVENGYTYEWMGPNGYSSSASSGIMVRNNLTILDSGYYLITGTNPANGCTKKDSSKLVIIPFAPANIITKDSIICLGDSFNIRSAGVGTINWQPQQVFTNSASLNTWVKPSDSTEIILTVSAGNFCISRDTISLAVNKKPLANAGKDVVIFAGQTTTLLGAGVGTDSIVSWLPNTFLASNNTFTTIASPPISMYYILSVSSVGCGIAQDSVYIKVLKNIVIPNAFSPNGDGVNDTWQIEGLNTYTTNTVEIYNRYGQIVHSNKGYTKYWDGTFNGKPLPKGTYYYLIAIPEINQQLSGWVQIL